MNKEYYIHKIFLQNSLYQLEKFPENDLEIISDIFTFPDQTQLQFDCYCTECGKDSTFVFYNSNKKSPGSYSPDNAWYLKSLQTKVYPYNFVFKCQRNEKHFYYFSFVIKERSVTKIGQYPSLADIEVADIEKYRLVLKNDYRDFKKAIGLHSHGIGIGSFVYLRRIFENLIEEKHQEKVNDRDWDEEEYRRNKMDKKISMLKDGLPQVLVQNKGLYGIISKGIHELSEDECKELFPELQLAIELILDEKIYIQEKLSKTKRVSSFVSNATKQFKGESGK